MEKIVKNPKTRQYIYIVGVALAGLLVGYNIITLDQSGLWLNLLAAVLGVTNLLAAVNTQSTPDEPRPVEQEDEIAAFDGEVE